MSGVAYWQVAAGSVGRDYADQFIRYGLAFVGGRRWAPLFGAIKAGDRILLKEGLKGLAAVGKVVDRDGSCGGDGDKSWLRDFDGWDLPIYRFVRWHVPPATVEAEALSRGAVRRVNVPALRQLAEQALVDWPVTELLEPEPAPTAAVDDDQILSFLVAEGLRPASAQELTGALQRIRLLAKYYYDHCRPSDVREHETRTFLIAPFLVALGWPEQRLKVELKAGRGRIDLACFRRPYRRDKDGPNHDDCALILESKGFQHGLIAAPQQARAYADHFPACRTLVVSNGYCYKTFHRRGDESFGQRPSAYLNLLRPTERYPLDPASVAGCMEALRTLMPQG